MSQHGDFGAAARRGTTYRKLALEIRSQNAPVKIERWKRNQNHYQRPTLVQLPPGAFEEPRHADRRGKSKSQPRSNSPRDKQREPRRGDGGVGSKPEVGIELHNPSDVD